MSISLASRNGCITLRSTTFRERKASVAPAMLWMANSSRATRQCRFRHWDEMRVRTAPPKGIRLAKPESSRLSNAAG